MTNQQFDGVVGGGCVGLAAAYKINPVPRPENSFARKRKYMGPTTWHYHENDVRIERARRIAAAHHIGKPSISSG